MPYSTYAAAGKNKILNGDCFINQRNFSSGTTQGQYVVDRFQDDGTGGTITTSVQQFTVGAAPVAGYEAKQYMRTITATQSAAGHYQSFTQAIEDVRTLAGQTATVSFWAKAATGTPNIGATLQQNFGSGGSSVVTTSAAVQTITTSWARYSFQIAVPSISGKTIGTSSLLKLYILVSAGTTISGLGYPAVGLQNNTFDIWGVQVEAGSNVTAFQTATGNPASELAACQRYYYRAVTNAMATTWFSSGFAYNTTRFLALVNLPVRMRVNPTSIETSGTAAEYRVLVGGTVATATAVPTLDTSNWDNTLLNVDTSGLTAGQGGILGANVTNNAYIGFNAEL
jgi:hypothetical protein